MSLERCAFFLGCVDLAEPLTLARMIRTSMTALMSTLALAIAFGAAPARRASATVVRALSLAEKTSLAPVVVHAKVERTTAVEAGLRGGIETHILIRVVESIKGGFDPGRTLVVRQSGGQVGRQTSSVSGAATYQVGEEVVLFLEPLNRGEMFVAIGVGIGKYDVAYADGQAWVRHAPKVAALRRRPVDGSTDRSAEISAHGSTEGALEGGAESTTRGVLELAPVLPMKPERLEAFLDRLRQIRDFGADPAFAPPASNEERGDAP
ncbi:MAG: hypothetical protein H6729_14650 [Deltaproteobacteria bacterium]|nr:hypothetical protein [Deltaproteobacteria bacterium]